MPVLSRHNFFKCSERTSKEQFSQCQMERLKNLLLHASTQVPYYRCRFSEDIKAIIANDPFGALAQIPILNKSELHTYGKDLSVELGRGTFKNSSGGSTGEPVSFYQDREYQVNSLASTLLFYEWAGKKVGDSHALLWGAERDLVKGGLGFKQHFSDVIGNRMTLNAFRLSPERMREYVSKLNRFSPVCLEGYAECLFELARFIDRESLNVASPHVIVSSAGTLYPEMRKQIESVFAAEVFDRYGSREVGNMAAECEKHEGLHIFGETTIIEVVDENGFPVSEGEEGDVLVTNLTNYTMPLIRYRIGDRAVLGKQNCSCGRPYPLLERIAGRAGATFRTSDGGIVSPEFFIHLIGVMHNDGRISTFQVIQEEQELLIVLLVTVNNSDLAGWPGRELIIRQIRTVMGDSCKIEIRQEVSIEPTPTGKHLYTISRLAVN